MSNQKTSNQNVTRMPYLKGILVALDQLLNAIFGGWPDETLSSRCWRLSQRGVDWPRKIIDNILFFDKNHCEESFLSEKLGRQLPPEARVTE